MAVDRGVVLGDIMVPEAESLESRYQRIATFQREGAMAPGLSTVQRRAEPPKAESRPSNPVSAGRPTTPAVTCFYGSFASPAASNSQRGACNVLHPSHLLARNYRPGQRDGRGCCDNNRERRA